MKKLLLTFLFCLIASFAFGATYHIKQTATGDESGDSAVNADSVAEFNADNINGGTGAMAPGDTIYFSGTITTNINVPVSGTSGNVITLDGYAGGDCSPVVADDLCANGAILNKGMRIDGGEDYITIQDFQASGNGFYSVDQPFYIYNEYTGNDQSSYITFRRNYVHDGTWGLAIFAGTGNATRGLNNTIENNKFDTCGTGGDTANCVNFNFQDGLIIQNNIFTNDWTESTSEFGGFCTSANNVEIHGTHNGLIQNNIIEKGPNQGSISIKEPLGSTQQDIIVRYNIIRNSPQKGIGIGVVQGAYVYANLFHGNGINYQYNVQAGNNGADGDRAGIDIKDDAADVYIWSNIFYDNDRSGILIWSRNSLPPGNINIINNTFQHNGHSIDETVDSASDTGISAILSHTLDSLTIKNNLFVNNRGGDHSEYYQMYIGSNITTKDIEHNTLFFTGQTANWNYLGVEKSLAGMQALNFEDDDPDGIITDPGFTNEVGNDFTLDGSYVNTGKDLSECFGPITIQGVEYAPCYEDALDPTLTNWTTTPPTVATLKQGDHGNWERGAYVYPSTTQPSASGVRFGQLRINQCEDSCY